MQKYTQLTCEQRYHIYLLNKQGHNQTFIAKSMGRDKSTISRGLSRNTGKKGYRYQQADKLACKRHQNKNKAIKLTVEVKCHISEKLKEHWIPEQNVGRLALDKKIKISTEATYRFVLQNKAAVGGLYKHLCHQHKKYRKRYSKNDYRGAIPNRVDIDERLSIVDTRTRIGDWEVDLVIAKGHKGDFATFAER